MSVFDHKTIENAYKTIENAQERSETVNGQKRSETVMNAQKRSGTMNGQQQLGTIESERSNALERIVVNGHGTVTLTRQKRKKHCIHFKYCLVFFKKIAIYQTILYFYKG
jgi:hypothetical protein